MPLDSADLAALSRLLDQALDLDSAQVPAWLAALPPEHRDLAPQLSAMLADFRSPGHRSYRTMTPKKSPSAPATSSAHTRWSASSAAAACPPCGWRRSPTVQ